MEDFHECYLVGLKQFLLTWFVAALDVHFLEPHPDHRLISPGSIQPAICSRYVTMLSPCNS